MMAGEGLVKLVEECGELVQVAAKVLAYPGEEFHPDGRRLRTSLEEEIADVIAAMEFVMTRMELDGPVFAERAATKRELYRRWDAEDVYERWGLVKLVEECGELLQVAARVLAYRGEVFHPDGRRLRTSLEEEIAGVIAAIEFVMTCMELDGPAIDERQATKRELYRRWDAEDVYERWGG